MVYLVKYTAEIGTKERTMQWRFIQRLADNIRNAIQSLMGESALSDLRIHPSRNHIVIGTPIDLSGILPHIPGIKYYVEAREMELDSLEAIAREAENHFGPLVDQQETFAVRCRRTGGQNFSQKDVEVAVGDRLIDKGQVDLDNPDINCFIEIRKGTVYFYTERKKGTEGMPVRIQGKGLNLFSGGIDSPVAAWRTYRMGLDQDFLYFDLGGAEQKKVTWTLFKHLKKRAGAGQQGVFVEVDFQPVIRIIQDAEHYLQNLLLKYCFYRAADRIRRFHGAYMLITGESIGQVSTQTAANLSTLDQLSRAPVLRPLSGETKEEIIERARAIGTFDQAYKGKEFCAVATKKVSTATTPKRLQKAIEELDLSVLDRVVDERVVFRLNDNGEPEPIRRKKAGVNGTQRSGAKQEKVVPDDAHWIIDLRENGDKELGGNTERTSLQKAMNTFFHWDRSKQYYIVCETGSQSKMLAHYMWEEGFRVGYGEA